MRERQRETQRETEIDRQRDRQTETQRERETDRDREREREAGDKEQSSRIQRDVNKPNESKRKCTKTYQHKRPAITRRRLLFFPVTLRTAENNKSESPCNRCQ